ncbi:DUF4344 domain-containing metallopeptidase [Streptomyces sp. MB09-01]|uniref:DUF4344 domain-containing metallopeptidase n=1 Tax=Streptomyces sp. MB09-01 TaxID=3028666 RepID=UPI0029BD5B96|nr:DUF4344 domain-containing metallopeptidase [Streptomyces sp. MB09-01]MDX3540585.1 DUF4344 domain-containing metallopeptidase [Streptomyces sp. MB09-01]
MGAARMRAVAAVTVAAVSVITAATGCSSAGNGSAGPKTKDAAQSPASASASPGHGRLIPRYDTGRTAQDRRIQRFLQDNEVLERVAAFVDDRIALSYDVPVIAKSCGRANASWDPRARDITYCYELVEETMPIFQEQAARQGPGGAAERARAVDEDIIGFSNGVLLHELGHGLVDMYDLPITGKEEDAVDQLATLLLATGGEQHIDYAVSTLNTWGALADAQEAGDLSGLFSDEHSLSAQRFYNEICWLYGSDPDAFESVVIAVGNPDGVLPELRAEGCRHEYEQIEKSWGRLLEPYLK